MVSDALTPTQTLDCRGATYPVPILKAKRALDQLRAGQVLKVQATDPNTKPDLQVWAEKANADLLGVSDDADGSFSFLLRKR